MKGRGWWEGGKRKGNEWVIRKGREGRREEEEGRRRKEGGGRKEEEEKRL